MNKNLGFKRKRIRVKEFDYTGTHAYFITICTFNKEPYFKNAKTIANILNCLRLEANCFKFLVYAYCFMPDHLHLLLIGKENSDLLKFIKIFKQKSSFYFKRELNSALWQKSFFDHIIRKKQLINDFAGYIFNNPLRKKIIDDPRKYPYAGSFVMDRNEWYEICSQKNSLDLDLLIKN